MARICCAPDAYSSVTAWRMWGRGRPISLKNSR
jgi:hypothetical protein